MKTYESYAFLQIAIAEKIAVVTLNRPDARNAINPELKRELETIWLDLADDQDVNVIVLTGAGAAFCAGGDVKGMAARAGTAAAAQTMLSTPSRARRLIQNMLEVEQPIIGAINGDAVGAGATLALFCDITVMAEDARIGDPHVRVGLAAGGGGAVIWPLLLGPARGKEFLLRGHLVKGKEAERIGLVNHAVPAANVLPHAMEIAQELAAGATWAQRWSKLVVNKWLKEQVNLILDASLAFEMVTMATDDHKEAARAFAEKRKPKFTGR